MLKRLIFMGANINQQNRLGSTALHEAVKRTNFEIIKILKEQGADHTIQDSYGVSIEDICKAHDSKDIWDFVNKNQES